LPSEPDVKIKTFHAWRCKKCGYVGLYGLDKEHIVKIMTPGSYTRDMGYNCDNKGD
jgi:predicted nucleic-acid-binding Zn-ribbon protein